MKYIHAGMTLIIIIIMIFILQSSIIIGNVNYYNI